MTDIDYMVACLLIPVAYVIVYIAGKYDVITLFLQMIAEKVEEMNREEIGMTESEIFDAMLDNAWEEHDELLAYRAIGTVEKIKEELERLRKDNECQGLYFTLEERKYLARQSKELSEYHAIGTVEEFKALKEKADSKKPLKIKTDEKILYMCPSCRKVFIEAYDTVQRGRIPRHCEICGQNIKWCWGQ